MKHIYKILGLSVIIYLISSCSLEEEPIGFLSSSNFYQTESDALSATAHMYDILGDVGASAM